MQSFDPFVLHFKRIKYSDLSIMVSPSPITLHHVPGIGAILKLRDRQGPLPQRLQCGGIASRSVHRPRMSSSVAGRLRSSFTSGFPLLGTPEEKADWFKRVALLHDGLWGDGVHRRGTRAPCLCTKRQSTASSRWSSRRDATSSGGR